MYICIIHTSNFLIDTILVLLAPWLKTIEFKSYPPGGNLSSIYFTLLQTSMILIGDLFQCSAQSVSYPTITFCTLKILKQRKKWWLMNCKHQVSWDQGTGASIKSCVVHEKTSFAECTTFVDVVGYYKIIAFNKTACSLVDGRTKTKMGMKCPEKNYFTNILTCWMMMIFKIFIKSIKMISKCLDTNSNLEDWNWTIESLWSITFMYVFVFYDKTKLFSVDHLIWTKSKVEAVMIWWKKPEAKFKSKCIIFPISNMFVCWLVLVISESKIIRKFNYFWKTNILTILVIGQKSIINLKNMKSFYFWYST